MTRATRVVVQVTCVLVTLCSAQAAQGQSAPAAEITPFVGFGSAGSTSAGGAVAFVLTPKVRIESEVAYHRRALFSSSVNFVYSLPRLKAVAPYVTAGIGLGQCESAVQAPTPAGFVVQRSVNLVVNAGAGFTVPVHDRVGYRLDARWSNPLGTQPETWRIYHGATFGVGK